MCYAPQAELAIELETGLGESGRIAVSGPMRLTPMSTRLALELESIALDDFQPYVEDVAKLDVPSGKVLVGTGQGLARIEAGLLLMGVDFRNARFTWAAGERETPLELGWGWMFSKLDEDDRDFVGRAAIEAERRDGTSRWKTVGLAVDVPDYERVFGEAGVLAPRHEVYSEGTRSLYRRGDVEWDYAGYASSFLTSPILKRPIAIAKLPLDLAEPGSEVDLEVQVIRQPKNVLARVERMPFYNPPRKTAPMSEEDR